RLTVCEVDDGNGTRTIVCGAPNVATGQTVAVAWPGAIMPDGSQLGEAKLRGVKSSGMILAEDEVGISDDHKEIMVLENGARPGGREDRAAAALAEAAPDRRRPAADLERGRHHELRDAADRPAAARVRPRRGAWRPDHRPARAARRADDNPG